MERPRSRCVGRSLLSVFAAVVVLSLWFSVSADAGVLLSDTFSNGTTIKSSTWNVVTLYGPSGQFTQNSGLNYSGSATSFTAADSDWASLRSTNSFTTASGDIEGTIQFSDFTSSSTYTSGYTGLKSVLAFGMGPTTDELSITLRNGFIFAGLYDIVTRVATLLPLRLGLRHQFRFRRPQQPASFNLFTMAPRSVPTTTSTLVGVGNCLELFIPAGTALKLFLSPVGTGVTEPRRLQ